MTTKVTAVDCHAHVMRRDAPLAPNRHSAPKRDCTVEEYLAVLDAHGISHGLLTAPSFYGVEVGRSYDVAVLICSEPLIRGEESMYDMRHGWWLSAMGRLKPGWTLARATAQLKSISPAILEPTLPPVYKSDDAKKYMEYRFAAFSAENGFSNLRREYENPLWTLLAIAGLVLSVRVTRP